MEIVNIILCILLILVSIALVITVLFQSGGRSSKLSQTIAGGSSDNYIGKNKQRAKDKFLGRVTTILAIVFAVLVLATSVVIYYRVGNDAANATDTTTPASTVSVSESNTVTDGVTNAVTDAATVAATDAETAA